MKIFNENLYKQSKFLEIIALKVYDSINEVRENIELSDADSQNGNGILLKDPEVFQMF